MFIALLVSPLPVNAEKEFMDDWHFYGSNSLRGSLYDSFGEGSASPYPFEGGMFYNEFNLYLNKKFSRFDHWRIEASGVANHDEYRSTHNGIVPERLNFTRENGESTIPYRLETGDFFSYYSYLTLQRSLKGIQVEFQPKQHEYGWRHSVILTAGAEQPTWVDFSFDDNFTSGISWLIQDMPFGVVSFNLVHNLRDRSFKSGTLHREQHVFSLAAEKPFTLPGHDLVLEAEFAHFGGDHNGVTTAASGQDQSDNGYFLQISGQSQLHPWDYRLKVEHYGDDFQPQGAVITPHQRSIEAHTGWRFDNGIRFRGRGQVFENNFETTNKLRTKTYGVNFSGPIISEFFPDATGTLDAYIQHLDDELKTVNSLSQTVNLDVSKPLPQGWFGRLGFFFQNLDDSSTTNADNTTRQLTLSADHSVTVGEFEGIITPGFLARTVRHGGNDSTDWSPSLALSLRNGPHEIGMDYGGLVQNRSFGLGSPDVDTYTLNMDYRYRKGQHLFGLEGNFFSRDPSPGDSTEAYRISAYWTYEFDRPPVAVAARTTTPVGEPAQVVPVKAEASIAGLAPGMTAKDIDAALKRSGITGGVDQAGWKIYEYPLLTKIIRRQRLGLEYVSGVLDRSALIIEFDDVGDRDVVAQTFERVRQELIRQLGSPTRVIEQGEFSPGFVQDVNDQRFIRVTEWETERGTIRFGIPRRLDRQVRMEIQHARTFPQPRETLWSIGVIR